MSKKIFAGVLAIMFAISLMPTTPVKAATVEELLLLITQLQAQLAQLQGGQQVSTGGYQFTRNLTLGSRGADVMELQKILIAKGYLVLNTPTQLFGPMTKAAVIAWQKASNINPPAGYVGPLSRAALNSMGGGGGGGGVIPTNAFLKIESVPMTANSIPSGSIYNPVLKLKLSAGNQAVTVTGLKVVRGGYISNTNVTGVSVWDEMGNRYGNIITSLTSDGEANFSFGSTPISIGAGMSKTVTIAANLHASSTNGTISFSVMNASSVTAVGGPVMGVFPVMGSVMTIVDGSNSLGDVRIDDKGTVGTGSSTAQTASYDGNIEVGYTTREIYKFSVTQNNSKEAITLNKIVMYVGGTIQEDRDLKNFKLVSQEGNVVATADRAYDRYVTFNLATPYTIDKGLAKDFTVQVDITDGSGRYFYMTIQNDYDVVVRGVTTGAATLAKDSGGNELTASDVQNDSTGWFKIKTGAATVTKSSSSPSGTISPGTTNVVLARFDVRSSGEALEIRKIGVQVKFGGVASLNGTLSVRNANTQETYLSISADTTGIVTSTTPVAGTLLNFQQNLSSYINLAAGETKTIEVLGSIPQTATSSWNYTVYTGQYYAKRISSNDYTTLSASAVSANQLTVKDVSVDVTKDASFPNTNRSTGSSNVLVGRFNARATGDDVRLNSIQINIGTSSNYQNVKLMDGSTQLGNTIGTPTDTGNSFSLTNYVIAKDVTKTISVYADILSNATDTSVVSVTASGMSGVGVNSGKSLSSTPSTAIALQTITLSTPSLTIAADSGKPNSAVVVGSQSAVELHRLNFQGSNDTLSLRKITLALQSASTTQWSTSTLSSNFGNMYLYDGSTLLGTGTVNSSVGTVVFSGFNVSLPQDQSKVLTVKADITGSGTLASRSVGAIKLYATSTDDMEVYSNQGQLDPSGITVTSNALSNYMLFHDAVPTIAAATPNHVTQSATDIIGAYTITNVSPSGRDLTMTTTTVTVSLGGSYSASSTVTTLKLLDDSDTIIATSSGSVTGTTTSVAFTFGSFTNTQTISAGASRTYKIMADTTAIRTGVTSGNSVTLTTSIAGNKGYDSTDVTSPEYYWNTGNVFYSYVPINNNGVALTGNRASNSYNAGSVSGTTITY